MMLDEADHDAEGEAPLDMLESYFAAHGWPCERNEDEQLGGQRGDPQLGSPVDGTRHREQDEPDDGGRTDDPGRGRGSAHRQQACLQRLRHRREPCADHQHGHERPSALVLRPDHPQEDLGHQR